MRYLSWWSGKNHKDHVGFDWLKEGIYLDDIQKFKDNCKMSVMDSLEKVGGILVVWGFEKRKRCLLS